MKLVTKNGLEGLTLNAENVKVRLSAYGGMSSDRKNGRSGP